MAPMDAPINPSLTPIEQSSAMGICMVEIQYEEVWFVGVARRSSSLSDMDLSDMLTETDLMLSVMDWSERDPLEGELEIADSVPGATPMTVVCRLVGQLSRNLDCVTPCSL